jgi:hypothetical protein
MNTNDQPTKGNEKWMDDFLIAEYSLLQSNRESLTTEIDNRGNFFLAIVSASFIAIGALAQSRQSSVVSAIADAIPTRAASAIPDGVVSFLVIIMIMILIIVGLLTFIHSVRRSYRKISYTEKINAIRDYFSKFMPDVQNPISLEFKDKSLPYKLFWGDHAQSIAVINSALIGIGISLVCVTQEILPCLESYWWSVSFICFTLSIIGHYYLSRILAKEFQEDKSRP